MSKNGVTTFFFAKHPVLRSFKGFLYERKKNDVLNLNPSTEAKNGKGETAKERERERQSHKSGRMRRLKKKNSFFSLVSYATPRALCV